MGNWRVLSRLRNAYGWWSDLRTRVLLISSHPEKIGWFDSLWFPCSFLNGNSQIPSRILEQRDNLQQYLFQHSLLHYVDCLCYLIIKFHSWLRSAFDFERFRDWACDHIFTRDLIRIWYGNKRCIQTFQDQGLLYSRYRCMGSHSSHTHVVHCVGRSCHILPCFWQALACWGKLSTPLKWNRWGGQSWLKIDCRLYILWSWLGFKRLLPRHNDL